MDKKISIVIPYYNGSRYIQDLLESIHIQTYSNIEVIIIDDGSIDNESEALKEVIKKYPEINVIYKKKGNGGISSARNAGLEISSGEYITFIDQDDILCGRFSIEFRVDYLNSKPEIDLIAGYNLKIDNTTKYLQKRTPETATMAFRNAIENDFALSYLEYYEEKQKLFFFTTGSSLIRKTAIGKIKFDSSFNQVEDIDFTLELLRAKKKIDLIKVPFYLKRTHDNQASKNTPIDLEKRLLNKIVEIKKLYK